MPESLELTPAETASQQALQEMYACLEAGESFRLDAGAGAGKTYSLVRALRWLIGNRQVEFARNQQKVACITFTNVATDEIEDRIDRHPLIAVSTIHSFCWSLIGGFQKQLRDHLGSSDAFAEKLEEAGGIGSRRVEYNLGIRFVSDEVVSLAHDDILPMMVKFMEHAKFRVLLTAQFPVILIDEYQDTDAKWVGAISEHFFGSGSGPQFGLFGDHWQKIYGTGCGEISHPSLKEIGKNANFRSTQTIVNHLNQIRPDLPQLAEDPNSVGEIKIFHTNQWTGERRSGQGGGHWTGDLPEENAREAYSSAVANLTSEGWDFDSDQTKVLMLTHRVLAKEQGYSSIVETFKFRDDWYVPEQPHLKFFKEKLEPARTAFSEKRFGDMMEAFSSRVPVVSGAEDKRKWSALMSELATLADQSTIGGVIDFIMKSDTYTLPADLLALEKRLAAYEGSDNEEKDRRLRELEKLRAVPYTEIQALVRYLNGYSPFETKHGVKGLEFESVFAVFGRGWNHYNFGQMLEWASEGVPEGKEAFFERNRNLFYVCCSRAKSNLALLFTQELSEAAMSTLELWFGPEAIQPLEF